MVDVATVRPDTTPVDEPIVAAAVLLLTHVPPGTGLVNVDGVPLHTDNVPPIAPGEEFTVSARVLTQPEGSK